MERLLRVASPLGLYAEEFDTSTGRHLGNFPQAFSHLALIEAAARIVVARCSRSSSRDRPLRRDRDRQRRRRRHARPAPGSVGQADPAARARRLAHARTAELGRARRVRRRSLHLAGHVVRRRHGQGVPAAGPLLRRRRDQAVRRGALPPARGGLRRAPAPRRHLPGVADRLRRDGAVLHAGGAGLPGARRARRGSDRAARERSLPVPRRLARAAHPAARGRPRRRRASIRSTLPAA